MSTWQKILIVFASILASLFLVVDLWYLYILFFAPQKINSYTHNFDMQVSADGTLEKNIIEINYYSNKNNNGYEVFEIKFNTLKDEDKSTLISKGYQFVASDNQKLNFDWGADKLEVSSKENWVANTKFVTTEYSYSYYVNGSEYQYTTDNLSDTSFVSTSELSDETLYKIQIGSNDNEQIIGLQFKGEQTPLNNDTLVASQNGKYNFVFISTKYETNHYVRYDAYYLSQLLFNSIQSLEYGTNHTIAFDFDNLFRYYECNEDSTYKEELVDDESTKVINDIKNYFGIKVFITEDGLQRSSDSLFGIFKGSADFNLSPELGDINFFTGNSIIDVSLRDFNLVEEDGVVTAVLSDDFINRYEEYKEQIELNVTLNALEINENHGIFVSKIDCKEFTIYDGSNINLIVNVGSNIGGIY